MGAGFSFNAGLPLTNEFTTKLLNVRRTRASSGSAQVNFLRGFVHDAFDHLPFAKAQYWPALEDLFTCVDLAANSGHHLGAKYSPSELRTVRRALIVRTIRMLQVEYRRAQTRNSKRWKTLASFFASVDIRRSAFISMNWDTVIEDGLLSAQAVKAVDYGCGAIPAQFTRSVARKRPLARRKIAHILKLHGSVNWLYCDNCRDIFWFPSADTLAISDQLFRQRDWDIVARHSAMPTHTAAPSHPCPSCRAESLGTRLATFSYRKALDFPMYQRSWLTAEELLRRAATWVFIGYSMPAADYEFKYLLKKVQLARAKNPPNLVLITGGNSAADTYHTYQRFFGRGITRATKHPTSFERGLTRKVLQELRARRLLK